MDIKLAGKVVTPAQVRKLGFALINLATQTERQAVQLAQALANPTEKEQAESAKASARAVQAMGKVRRLYAEMIA